MASASHSLSRRTCGERFEGWSRAPPSSFFIRLEGYLVDIVQAMHAPANLPSGQAVKRELFIRTKPGILLELHGAAGQTSRVEAWEGVIRKIWKWGRLRHPCPKAEGKLRGPGTTEEAQKQNPCGLHVKSRQ